MACWDEVSPLVHSSVYIKLVWKFRNAVNVLIYYTPMTVIKGVSPGLLLWQNIARAFVTNKQYNKLW